MIGIVDNTSFSPGASKVYFTKILCMLRNGKVPFKVVRFISDITSDISAFILSGSPVHIPHMSKEQMNLNTLVLASHKPVFGICFGSQFICTYFGGTIEEMPRFVCSSRVIRDQSDNELFSARFCARYRIEQIPKCCVPYLYATLNNKHTVVGFKHNTRPIFATLFHPEYSPATQDILLNFVKTTRLHNTLSPRQVLCLSSPE